ncbi:probable carboxylesterase 3 [Ananas comosus]|uniref:Probable carboxylesterase 3 n=1 Tax=Ananas comosus TaxID=4615 RepID=A0A6P5FQ54_ANACO|nr:probable carboxylesterase 3 [Ananas comosus]
MIVVSVEYRRAPEHPLPAAYDDAWATLRCAAARVDRWLAERGNLARVFLGGDSAGANIAHNVAMRVATEGLGVKIEGSILIHPVLGGERDRGGGGGEEEGEDEGVLGGGEPWDGGGEGSEVESHGGWERGEVEDARVREGDGGGGGEGRVEGEREGVLRGVEAEWA